MRVLICMDIASDSRKVLINNLTNNVKSIVLILKIFTYFNVRRFMTLFTHVSLASNSPRFGMLLYLPIKSAHTEIKDYFSSLALKAQNRK